MAKEEVVQVSQESDRHVLKCSMCKVMGIVNVTPDSFSDGGKFNTPEEAIRRARNLVDEGAAIIDIGGESTRPGATPITWQEEWARIEPVVSELGRVVCPRATAGERDARPYQVSVDTYHAETAERAIAAGATMINCVYEEPVEEMLRVVSAAERNIDLVIPAKALSKIEGTQSLTANRSSLTASRSSLITNHSSLIIDPMIGFGTTREEDLRLLQEIPELAKKGRVLVGASRKRIVKKLTGEKVPGKDLAGNLTIAVWAALKGASIVRVHDVRETVQALKVLAALQEGVAE